MSTNKPAASLTSALLAPKGAAKPSAPLFGGHTAVPQQPAASRSESPRSLTERAERALRKTLPKAEARAADTKKAAFTFRIDEAQHLRLRLLSAHSRMSSQKILEAALEAYLQQHGPQSEGEDCHCFSQAVGH